MRSKNKLLLALKHRCHACEVLDGNLTCIKLHLPNKDMGSERT